MASINDIKEWFKTNKKPTQQQFWATWDSFWHKDENIPISKIQNLVNSLLGKADKGQFDAHVQSQDAHGITQRLAQKAPLEHSHEIEDINGLTEALENANVGPATATEIGGVKLAGDLAGPATAPTVPTKLNKGANTEFQDIDATSEKHGFALFTRLGAIMRTPSLIWDETNKRLTIAGTQAVWQAYSQVPDGNMGIKALANALTAFKLFDDNGNFLTLGTRNAKRYLAIHNAVELVGQNGNNQTEFISVDSMAATDVNIKTFDVPSNSLLVIDVSNIAAFNVDKKSISGRAQFTVVNSSGVLTEIFNATDDLRLKQYSTIKSPEGLVTSADARIAISIAGTVVTLKFINPVGGKLATIHCEVKHNITLMPE